MLTIGKIAARADAIRYYEREGLLAPAQKSDAGYRLYDDNAVRRVGFIKQAQKCGFSLAEKDAISCHCFGGTASHSIDQKSAEIWTGQANLQPIPFKSDRLLAQYQLLVKQAW